MFGSAVVPDACGCMKSTWQNDPFAKGSYSYIHKEDYIDANQTDFNESNGKHRHGKFDKSNIIYAGEAVSDDYRGTVHGAILEGQKAAKSLFTSRNTDTIV